MTVKGQSVFTKTRSRRIYPAIDRGLGADANQQAKASFGPKMPSLRFVASTYFNSFFLFITTIFLFITTFFSIRHIYDIIIMVSNLFYCIDLGYKSNTDQSLQYRNVNFLIAYKTIIVFIFLLTFLSIWYLV